MTSSRHETLERTTLHLDPGDLQDPARAKSHHNFAFGFGRTSWLVFAVGLQRAQTQVMHVLLCRCQDVKVESLVLSCFVPRPGTKQNMESQWASWSAGPSGSIFNS